MQTTQSLCSIYSLWLKHYFQEIQPTLRLLPFQLYNWLEDIATENERDLGLIHPVLPDQVGLSFVASSPR